MKTQIQYKKKKIKYGFIGMNFFAHYHCRVKWPHVKHPEEIIEIYKNMPKDLRYATIQHEKCERYLMKNKHFNYLRAHKNALRFEKLNKSFPAKNIKKRLERMNFKIL